MTHRFTAALALLLLAGCSNDPAQVSPMVTAGKLIGDQLRARSDARQLPPPEAVLAQTELPVILVRSTETELAGYLLEIARNGPVRTYGTPDRRTMSFHDGILVATRGLGDDMMSADISTPLAALAAARTGAEMPGGAREILRLGGAGSSEVQRFDCSYARGEAGEIAETCAGPGGGFTNLYVLDEAGAVARSRQWISPNVGPVEITVLRQ